MPKILTSVLSLAAALVLFMSVSGFAQESGRAPGASKDAESDVETAEVAIDGETLFSVRGVKAHPAERRAEQIADRVREVAANSKIGPESLRLEEHPGATWILAGGQRIMAVLDEDAAIEDISRDPLATLYQARIAHAIDVYRRDRQPALLWLRALYALGATVVLLLIARFGRRLAALLRAILERRYRARIEGLEGRAYHMVKVERIWRALTGLLNLAWGLALAVAVYTYLHYVLGLFPWTRGFANHLYSIAIDPLRTMGSGLVGIIPNLVFLAILIVIVRYVLKMIRALFDGVGSGTVTLKGFDPDWAGPTYRLVRMLVIVFAIVVGYPYIPGSESGAFKGVSLFIGIIFSLGSSSFISNFIAGYSVTYRRAFRVGDRVKIGDQIGDVEQIRLLVTHLRTIKNEEVVVPNSTILGNEVVNYSTLARDPGLILHTTVGIRYDAPWRQVEAILLEAAARTPGLRREPPPFVLKKELRDFYVTYEINVYCDTPQKMASLYTELHGNILDVFNEYGIQIMVPAYEGDPDQPKIVPKERWYAAPASSPQSGTSAAKQDGPGGFSEDNRELTRA
ncbi:MAG TPA: mechanosensitive ion channel family protein [Bryobacteraceae bacterium]|jgi:small-conductance mechanosensitive channel